MANLGEWQPDILSRTSAGQIYDEYKGAQQEARETGQKAYEQYASPGLFAVTAKRSLTKAGPDLELREREAKLKGELSQVYSEYASPDKYPEITNPILRDRITEKRAATLRKQLGVTQARRQEAEGTISEWIEFATAGIQTTNERLKLEWDIKRDAAAQLLQEYGIVSEAEAQKRADEWARTNFELELNKFDESKRQFETQMAFSEKQLAQQAALARSSGGRSSGSSSKINTTHINKAIQILQEEEYPEWQWAETSGKTEDKLLSQNEAMKAYARIASYASSLNINPDDLFNTAMSTGAYDIWRP
jgi:hypothetical protein